MARRGAAPGGLGGTRVPARGDEAGRLWPWPGDCGGPRFVRGSGEALNALLCSGSGDMLSARSNNRCPMSGRMALAPATAVSRIAGPCAVWSPAVSFNVLRTGRCVQAV